MKGKENCSKACPKCCRRHNDTAFCARNLGHIAGEELEHRLATGELAHRRGDTESITREKDAVVGVVDNLRRVVIGDVVNWIAHTNILRLLTSS